MEGSEEGEEGKRSRAAQQTDCSTKLFGGADEAGGRVTVCKLQRETRQID